MCDFSQFFGSIVNEEEGKDVNKRRLWEQYPLQLEATMFAMCMKLRLFPLVDDVYPYVGPCECVHADIYAKLKSLLEVILIVDWPFHTRLIVSL